MKKNSSTSLLRSDLTLVAVLAGFAIAAFVFRESLGILIFLAVGLATIVQLVRVVFLRGETGTLKKLWDALKDAFWGMG